MYYTINVSGAPTSPPRTQTILGLPADSFFRISAPLVMGLLSTIGLIYSVQGKQHVAVSFALTGLVMSSLVAAGQAVVLEEERGRL